MSEHREYAYVGATKIVANLPKTSRRALIQAPQDVLRWIRNLPQKLENPDELTVTFIIDTQGQLWINERRSEHVLCAAGGDVFSAGEMTFDLSDAPELIAVTNQSTGYCPEPDSWWTVETALDTANIKHPGAFTTAYLFRRCENCGTKNIIKDDWFHCGVCDAELPQKWNFDSKKHK